MTWLLMNIPLMVLFSHLCAGDPAVACAQAPGPQTPALAVAPAGPPAFPFLPARPADTTPGSSHNAGRRGGPEAHDDVAFRAAVMWDLHAQQLPWRARLGKPNSRASAPSSLRCERLPGWRCGVTRTAAAAGLGLPGRRARRGQAHKQEATTWHTGTWESAR